MMDPNAKDSKDAAPIPRARDQVERSKRLTKIGRLRFVHHWSTSDIAEQLEISERTVNRDLTILRRRLRKKAVKDQENLIGDIIQDLMLSYDEKIKRLWNEYVRLEEQNKKEETRPARMRIIEQVTETENSFIDQMKKAGLISSDLEIDDAEGGLLALIRVRREKIQDIISGGGGHGADRPSKTG